MSVAVLSIVRNGAAYVDRYAAQVAGLRDRLAPEPVRIVMVEGDSTDATVAVLLAAARAHRLELQLLHHDHGGPEYGSVDHVERWRNVSATFNVGFAALRQANDGYVLMVDTDLVWQPADIVRLLDWLEPGRLDAVAALAMHHTGRAYDTWGSRGLDGVPFRFEPPYHPSLEGASGLVAVSSAGCCVGVTGQVARTTEFRYPELANVGWCQDMREHGYALWLDPTVKVVHP